MSNILKRVATAAINSTVHAVASELRKMKEPKLAKLKSGYTAEANLSFSRATGQARLIRTWLI